MASDECLGAEIAIGQLLRQMEALGVTIPAEIEVSNEVFMALWCGRPEVVRGSMTGKEGLEFRYGGTRGWFKYGGCEGVVRIVRGPSRCNACGQKVHA